MRKMIVAGLVAPMTLLAGCGSATSTAHSPAASPAHAAAARTVPGCAGNPGVAFGTRPAAMCLRQVGGPDGGTLYWTRYPDAYQYYWQPKAGDMLVTETFDKPNGPLGMPIAWNGRLVTLGDGCVAADANSASHPPVSCFVAQQEGRFRSMTPAEQQSVADFWSVMQSSPAGSW